MEVDSLDSEKQKLLSLTSYDRTVQEPSRKSLFLSELLSSHGYFNAAERQKLLGTEEYEYETHDTRKSR